jgi:hypothetical protein
MSKVCELARHQWLKHVPVPERDIRRISNKFWSEDKAIEERRRRITLLAKGKKTDRALAQLLSETGDVAVAPVACCPLAARQFQIYVVDRALEIAEQQATDPIGITLLKPEWAVPFGELHRVNWRLHHQRLRRYFENALGRKVVVFGVAEVEADYSRQCWQPHYHLVAFVTEGELKTLRTSYFKSAKTGPRGMVLRRDIDANWYAYAAKLTAFRKIEVAKTGGGKYVRRKRLKGPQFREHMRFLASSRPTTSIFAMNCSLVKRSD